MKFLPALAVAMLLACHASAQITPVKIDPNLPEVYFETVPIAVETEGRRNPSSPAPAVTTLAWALSVIDTAGGGTDCTAACNAYRMAVVTVNPTVAVPQFLCRSSLSTTSFWYGSQVTGGNCNGRDATNAPVTVAAGAFLCGCCGTINRSGIPFTTGCASSIGGSFPPVVGGAACPAGTWGTTGGANGIPVSATAPAICAQATGTAGDFEFGSAYPPVGVATCLTPTPATVPVSSPFSRVCFNVRPYTPPAPPTPGNKGRKMF